MEQKQKQKSGFTGGGDFDSDLSVSHEIKVPSIEDVLAAAKNAIEVASDTLENTPLGGGCGCF